MIGILLSSSDGIHSPKVEPTVQVDGIIYYCDVIYDSTCLLALC